MDNTIIRFENVTKSYDDGTVVLKNINFELRTWKVLHTTWSFRLWENNDFTYYRRLYRATNGRFFLTAKKSMSTCKRTSSKYRISRLRTISTFKRF